MLLTQGKAKTFAGGVVREMIKKGANAETMRKHEIPTTVYYWVFGSGAWRRGTEEQAADEYLKHCRINYIY